MTGMRIILRAKGKIPEICGCTCRYTEHDRTLCDLCPIADAAKAREDGVHLVYSVLSSQELVDIQKRALTDIFETIKISVFNVSVYEEDEKECGLEFTGWTSNGVQMCHFVDLRGCENPYDPYAFLDRFQAMVDGFDLDEEVRLHMQDSTFSSAFPFYNAVVELEKWQEDLRWLVHAVWNEEKHVPGLRRGLAFTNHLSYKELLGKEKEG